MDLHVNKFDKFNFNKGVRFKVNKYHKIYISVFADDYGILGEEEGTNNRSWFESKKYNFYRIHKEDKSHRKWKWFVNEKAVPKYFVYCKRGYNIATRKYTISNKKKIREFRNVEIPADEIDDLIEAWPINFIVEKGFNKKFLPAKVIRISEYNVFLYSNLKKFGVSIDEMIKKGIHISKENRNA